MPACLGDPLTLHRAFRLDLGKCFRLPAPFLMLFRLPSSALRQSGLTGGWDGMA